MGKFINSFSNEYQNNNDLNLLSNQGRNHMKIFSQYKPLIAGLMIAAALPAFAHGMENLRQEGSDGVITVKIKTKLAAENITSAKDISVETNNGIVILKGVVASETEAAKAIEIAGSTKGVQKVDTDNLTVANSTQPLKDIYSAAKIKGAFIKYNITAPTGKSVPVTTVKVEVKEGVANLSGTVKQDWQSAKLAEIAKSVDGISRVNNTLTIQN